MVRLRRDEILLTVTITSEQPGDSLNVKAPDGRLFTVTAPEGVHEGSVLNVVVKKPPPEVPPGQEKDLEAYINLLNAGLARHKVEDKMRNNGMDPEHLPKEVHKEVQDVELEPEPEPEPEEEEEVAEDEPAVHATEIFGNKIEGPVVEAAEKVGARLGQVRDAVRAKAGEINEKYDITGKASKAKDATVAAGMSIFNKAKSMAAKATEKKEEESAVEKE